MLVRTIKLIRKAKPNLTSGQGLIETALLFPVLLIVLSGLIEFGFLLNEYLAMQDAARNAARFASDGEYYARDNDFNCSSTRDFYRQTGCLVKQELAQERPEIALDFSNGHDDTIVSAFAVTSGSVTDRFPGTDGQSGWSAAEHMRAGGSRNRSSSFSSSQISSRLNALAPNTGLVLVEIYYDYHQKLKLPWITAFLGDPLSLHNYAIMPLVSAEPTPTPLP